MAQKVRDPKLETRTARKVLKARGKPYYRSLEQGLHLGYRKLRGGAGRWVVRHYTGAQAYAVETIANADDLSDANGADVLSYDQAQAKARSMRDDRAKSGGKGQFQVNAAMAEYIAFLDANRKTAGDAEYRYDAYIREQLGDIEIRPADGEANSSMAF